MPKQSSKDESELAKSIIDEITRETGDAWCTTLQKNPVAAALGRLSGHKRGKTLPKKLVANFTPRAETHCRNRER